MHEIITLQLGQRANYLATHFWNTQESYFTYGEEEESPVDHDILFRQGIGADGTETFTPRTLIYDLKGGFGNLRKINALYELEEERNAQGLWNGPTVIQRQPAIAPNPYQQGLEEGLEPPALTSTSVRYWSDFNRVYFHPKSIVQLNEYELNSSLMPFENWDAGEEFFDSLDKEHDLLDRDVRSFAEEADQMQGLQIFTGVDDAWGGFAARYVDRLRDEYGKSTIWVWGIEDGLASIPRMQQAAKLANSSRSLSSISPQSSLYIPLSPPSSLPPYLNLESNSRWYLSALYSTAIESVTLPSRLKSTGSSFRETLDTLAAALNVNGKQNIAKLQMSIIADAEDGTLSNGNHVGNSSLGIADQGRNRDNRLPSQERSRTNGGYNDNDNPDSDTESETPSLDIDFFPSTSLEGSNRSNGHSNKKIHVFGQTETSRGYPSSQTEAASNAPDYDGHSRAKRRALNLPIEHNPPFIPIPYPILSSFPSNLFHSLIAEEPNPTNLNVKTRLSTTTEISLTIKEMRNLIIGRGVGIEEREALGNSLGEIEEGFVEGWDEGSDSGDDDF